MTLGRGIVVLVALALAAPVAGADRVSALDNAPRGSVSGRVIAVDVERGVVTVATPRGDLVLHGSPAELGELARGDALDATVQAYGGEPWLVAPPRFAPGVPADLEHARGAVDHVDVAAGVLVLRSPSRDRQTYRAHPMLLGSVSTDQEVSVELHRVGITGWVTTVDPAPVGEPPVPFDRAPPGLTAAAGSTPILGPPGRRSGR